MTSLNESLRAISPLDGRYVDKTEPLREYFSEMALMKYRCLVEIEYFIALSKEKKIKEFPTLSLTVQKKLRNIVTSFSITDAKRIKTIEKTTNHDVKAIEYFLREKIAKLSCKKYQQFLHFALTSEDINNLAYTLMWRDSVHTIYLPQLKSLLSILKKQAHSWRDVPLLALTHGQPASPTTIGKELAVFVSRLAISFKNLQNHSFTAKLNGATGTWAAHSIAYPKIDWISFSERFIRSFGLTHNAITTQIETADSLASSFQSISQINTILVDLCRDMWLYCMCEIFSLKRLPGEVGSSTMPHKINPIHFENGEGNLMLANSLFHHLANTLPVSRLQRDLTGSTLIRNIGVPLAYSLIACKNIIIGLERIAPNQEACAQELDKHWEILAEAVQTLLRKQGVANAYETIKSLTRGKSFDKNEYNTLIQSLPLTKEEKNKLSRLSPRLYIGLAKSIVSLLDTSFEK